MAGGSARVVWGDPRVERWRPAGELLSSFLASIRLMGLRGTFRRLRQLGAQSDDNLTYQRWLARNTLTAEDLRQMAAEAFQFTYRPKISIVTPVYNTDPRWLQACIDSVRRQVYEDWELCLCDDGSSSEATVNVLRQSASDPRVRIVRLESNQGISVASNAALAMATGEFVAMLDHDDVLAPEALYEVVRFLNNQPAADMIYSDEDKLDQSGRRCDPHFKPDWSPDYFLTCMYTCHLMVLRTSLVAEVGGFRAGYEGSQDYDLVLRVMARTSTDPPHPEGSVSLAQSERFRRRIRPVKAMGGRCRPSSDRGLCNAGWRGRCGRAGRWARAVSPAPSCAVAPARLDSHGRCRRSATNRRF